jgi:hypothetical protein
MSMPTARTALYLYCHDGNATNAGTEIIHHVVLADLGDFEHCVHGLIGRRDKNDIGRTELLADDCCA